jgi:hypothetical protein
MQIISLAKDIVRTFMGAFNAYEIQNLKSKSQDMCQGHNLLITQQQDVDIQQMKESP